MADKEKTEVIQICTGFRQYKLISEKEGQRRFWDDLMKELEDNDFSVLYFNVPVPDGAAAYFTNNTGYRMTFDSICCPVNTADIDTANKTVKFRSERDFAIFVHECSHWRHLVRDKGVCQAKGIAGKVYQSTDISKSHRRDIEYEAGWRAIVTDNIYQLFEPRVSLEVNLINMFCYDHRKVDKEKRKIYSEIFEDIEVEDYQKLLKENILVHVDKFSEWSDPEHEIIGFDELLEAGKEFKKKD